jgi:hypothetical protein
MNSFSLLRLGYELDKVARNTVTQK